ncbi:divergent PAP2 family protein [Microaerobacter geothermalis]|uniref:divergent PAP2 family protein n=1 Tax=Microaerobacter geothermalis TaxID=674972 RepID=UPI001F38ABF1|nr:divergent PAP2 family protein [Microaerobacter geothermalis]MCF6092466.1 divergent PAP2 family protein [Microaerobacter geothermalis]
MSLFNNYPLWASLLAISLAQVVKIPIHYWGTRVWNVGLLFSTGGMPSSHSAAVTSLSTAIGLTEGFQSGLFAVSLIIGLIVMYDAAGIRRHAGEQAVVLNKLVEEFNHLVEGMKTWTVKPKKEKKKKLKELLGHQPVEVLIGGLLGIIVALALYPITS